jgi:3-oxoacyl-[acyl-carrier protein] reductase
MRKVALITGGTRGIGLGISSAFAKAGFDLAINGLREESLVEPVITELKSWGSEVKYIQGNISNKKDREKIVKYTLDHYGRINVLVNNAGIAPPVRNDILEATEDSFDIVIGTNLKGPYFLTQLMAKHMIELKNKDSSYYCCIINISSVSAVMASVNRGEYCISKAGMAMATKLWAARLGEFDIPVYEIQPGIIHTDMTAGVEAKYDDLFEKGISIQKRWGTPDDVGKVAAAMAAGSLPYSTGQVVMVDGGMTILRL